MTQTDPSPDTSPTLPPELVLYEEMMSLWAQTWLAATDQYLRLWVAPFTCPPDDECEEPGQLDIPGPLERHSEHGLFA